jgi:hypothetical protein
MYDLLSQTPQALAMAANLDLIHARQDDAASLAQERYERHMIAEAFRIAAGHSDAPPHIEHIRLLCELVARQRVRRPYHELF